MAFEDFDVDEIFSEAQHPPGVVVSGLDHFHDLDEWAYRGALHRRAFSVVKFGGFAGLIRYRRRLEADARSLRERRRKRFFFTRQIDAQILGIEQRLRHGKLTACDVRRIREGWSNGASQVALAQKYAVSQPTVYQILIGATYLDVGGPIHTPHRWKYAQALAAVDPHAPLRESGPRASETLTKKEIGGAGHAGASAPPQLPKAEE